MFLVISLERQYTDHRSTRSVNEKAAEKNRSPRRRRAVRYQPRPAIRSVSAIAETLIPVIGSPIPREISTSLS